MNFILGMISFLLAILFWNEVSGKFEGDKLDRSFRLRIGQYMLHIHHWIWASLVLFLCFYFEAKNSIFVGFLLGSVIQGLKYRDRFIVFYKEKDFENIYLNFDKKLPRY